MSPRYLPAWWAVILFLMAGTTGTQAADRAVLVASPDSALAATIAQLPGEMLALDAAVAQASLQATEARIAEARLAAYTEIVRREKGTFDPELFGSADWSGADTPSASLFAGADVLETESSRYETGARITLPLGTELTATVNSWRNTSNSAFAALVPEYQSAAGLSLRQPLLKGFGPSARANLDVAVSNQAAAGARYDGSLLGVRAEVETVYWELYAAERNHAVNQITRQRAAAFLSDAEKRARAGIIGPSQVANAEFFLAEADQAVFDTEENLDRLSDRLASLTGRRPTGVRFRVADEPPRDFALVDQDTLVAVALRRNLELQALEREADAIKALERGAVWDARPTFDLVGGLGGNGLSGVPQDVFFPGNPTALRTTIDGDRGEAISQSLGRDHPTWNVGFVFALPLGNREGKGERGRVRAEVVRAEQVLLGARRSTEEQVRTQYRELERGRERLAIAARGVAASIKQVDIGMIEYRNGRTTAFEVVRLAADLARAQQRYSDALVRTARAAAILRQLTGGWYGSELAVATDEGSKK
jgi:outer membrane protein TolC